MPVAPTRVASKPKSLSAPCDEEKSASHLQHRYDRPLKASGIKSEDTFTHAEPSVKLQRRSSVKRQKRSWISANLFQGGDRSSEKVCAALRCPHLHPHRRRSRSRSDRRQGGVFAGRRVLQILAKPLGELDFEVQSREARQHPRSPTELEEKRFRAISPFAQTRRASYPGRLLSDHPAPPMPVATTSVLS